MNATPQPVPAVIENPPVAPPVWIPVQQPNPVPMVDHGAVQFTAEQVEEMAASLNSRERWQDLPICGVAVVLNDKWKPGSVNDVPPSFASGLDMAMLGQFAMLFNQSQIARTRRRWALVTNRGTLLFLTGIKPNERPIHPADFPACVAGGLNYNQAESMAREANEHRHATAHVPRQWSVSLRRADCCDLGAVKGGAA
jgi:hypothetical protein